MSDTNSQSQIPEHVLAAFQVERAGKPVDVAWDGGLRFGRVVISPATPTSSWSSKAREKLATSLDGLRFSRPVRATDGRLVVGGFVANEFAEGTPAARVDEAIAGALLYDAAASQLDPPPSDTPEDPWVAADRSVWGHHTAEGELTVAHLDFLASCLFHGSLPPTLATLAPSGDLRPRGYTAALVIVDGLLAQAVDPGVVRRWAHIPRLPELTRKALEFRELAPGGSDTNMRSNIDRVSDLLLDERASIEVHEPR